jgi:hypothetical protein
MSKSNILAVWRSRIMLTWKLCGSDSGSSTLIRTTGSIVIVEIILNCHIAKISRRSINSESSEMSSCFVALWSFNWFSTVSLCTECVKRYSCPFCIVVCCVIMCVCVCMELFALLLVVFSSMSSSDNQIEGGKSGWRRPIEHC